MRTFPKITDPLALSGPTPNDLNGWYEIDCTITSPFRISRSSLVHLVQGKVHSLNDQPALIIPRGNNIFYLQYYFNNSVSRLTGPALLDIEGPLVWSENNLLFADNRIIRKYYVIDNFRIDPTQYFERYDVQLAIKKLNLKEQILSIRTD